MERCLGFRLGDVSKGQLLEELVFFSPSRDFNGVLVAVSSGLRIFSEV